MNVIRRYLACAAAAILLAQGTVLSATAVTYAGVAFNGGDDCCVKGSHPPGMCPLHRKSPVSNANSRTCRLSCAASAQALATLVVVLPLPSQSARTVLAPAPANVRPASIAPIAPDLAPTSPPPETRRT